MVWQRLTHQKSFFWRVFPLEIHPKQWDSGAHWIQICFLVTCTFHKEKDTRFNCFLIRGRCEFLLLTMFKKGELECLHSVLWANVCGLREMCYQELVNIVLAEPHTRERQQWLNERTAYVTWFAQSNHIPHTLSAPEKSDSNSQISRLPLCFLLLLPVKSWGGRKEGIDSNILWMFTWKPEHMFP